jgi:putative ABC transport system permease protein
VIARLLQALARSAALFRGRRLDQAIHEDLATHLDLLTDDLIAGGMESAEAAREARRRLGGVASAVEIHRDARSFRWIDDARRDVGYAVRTLRRTPGFTAAAVATLALGIGGVTLMYSVIHHVLVAPYPYRAADRIVQLRIVTDRGGMSWSFSAHEFREYQEQWELFEAVAGVAGSELHFVDASHAERLTVTTGTPQMFDFLGVAPLLGRYFGPADAEPGAPAVAVVSHRTWTSLFGQDPGIVGRAISLNGQPRTVIGVMPPRFAWQDAALWIPATSLASGAMDAVGRGFTFYARLRPGVTPRTAEARLDVIVQRQRQADAMSSTRGRLDALQGRLGSGDRQPAVARAQIRSILDQKVGDFRAVLYTVFAAVVLLLVIACCNVANMLLARATSREREIAVRAALGAGRWRIVRQLLAESLVLGLGGVAGGTLLAAVGIRLVQGWMPLLDVPAEATLRLDVPVLLAALSAGLLATLASGLYPALHGARRDLIAGWTGADRSGTPSRRQRLLRSGLVVAEVALALLLVLGAGLLLRSFLHRIDFDLGFDHRRVFVTQLGFPSGPPPAPAVLQQSYRDVLDRVGRMPGVQGAAMSSSLPPFGAPRSSTLGLARPVPDEPARADLQFCSEGILDALGIGLVTGRALTAADLAVSRKVALVNETLARRYFGTESPLGQFIRIDQLATQQSAVPDPVFEIVGVVQDVANRGVSEPPDPAVYLPYSIPAYPPRWLFVRSMQAPERLAVLIREQVRAINPGVALRDPGALQRQMPSMYPVGDEHRFSLLVLAAFATTGLGLVGLGVYGVIAYTVSQQAREFAIRLALGGERRHVAGHVLRTTLWLVGTGTFLGLGAGLAAGRLIASQLYQTSPRDPVTLAAGVVVILVTAALACLVPARRAMRVEPAVALRHDE